MVLKINEAYRVVIQVVNESNFAATGKTISYKIYDETMTEFATGSMTEKGTTGLYYVDFTPDATGYWVFQAYYLSSDFHFYDSKTFQVDAGIENQIEEMIKDTPTVNSIFHKTGGAVCPTGKSIWDALGDGTVSLNAVNTLLVSPVYGLEAINNDLDELLTRSVGSTTDSSFTLANALTEQDAVVITLTTRNKIFGVDLDVSNLTQPTTFRIYRKVDGTNYRLADSLNWSSSDPDIVFIQTPFAYDEDIKITIQSSVVEGATREIPYKIVKETMD